MFIDDAKNVPPFQHNGKTAVRAVLFKCVDMKGNVVKPAFVQWLECYDDESKSDIEARIQKGEVPLAVQFAHGSGMKMRKKQARGQAPAGAAAKDGHIWERHQEAR